MFRDVGEHWRPILPQLLLLFYNLFPHIIHLFLIIFFTLLPIESESRVGIKLCTKITLEYKSIVNMILSIVYIVLIFRVIIGIYLYTFYGSQ